MWICGICLLRAIRRIRIIFNINIGVNPEWYEIFPNTVDKEFLDIHLNSVVTYKWTLFPIDIKNKSWPILKRHSMENAFIFKFDDDQRLFFLLLDL